MPLNKETKPNLIIPIGQIDCEGDKKNNFWLSP